LPYFELKEDEFKLPPAYFADIDGLLAVGGAMSTENILMAYHAGAYYWHHPLKRIQWWSPDPRIVLYPATFDPGPTGITDGCQKLDIRFNEGFEAVLRLCQTHYNQQDSMSPHWLSERMFRIFMELHRLGYAHSIEVWKDEQVQGGLFGVAIGELFFGEYLVAEDTAMAQSLAVQLIQRLREKGFKLLDMQKPTVFVPGLEYEEMARITYLNHCKENELAFAGHHSTLL